MAMTPQEKFDATMVEIRAVLRTLTDDQKKLWEAGNKIESKVDSLVEYLEYVYTP